MQQTIAQIGFKKRAIVAIPPSTSLKSALETMSNERINSICIKSSTSSKITAIVNTFDILCLFTQGTDNTTIEYALGLDPTFESYLLKEIDHHETIQRVIDVMSNGVHRLLVSDSLNSPLFILSQYDVVCYLMNFDVGSVLIQDVGFEKNVVSVDSISSAIDAFKKMQQFDLVASPIVNQQNEIVGNISASDLKGLIDFSLLEGNVLDFVGKRKPVCCSVSDELKLVLELVKSLHVHRIWVVDNGVCAGVISLSDILRWFKKKN